MALASTRRFSPAWRSNPAPARRHKGVDGAQTENRQTAEEAVAQERAWQESRRNAAAIWRAVEKGGQRELAAAVEQWAAQGRSRMATRNEKKQTPLIAAAAKGDTEAVRLLMKWCNVEARDAKDRTALMVAAASGHLECVTALAEHCDVNAKTPAKGAGGKGATALHEAVAGGAVAVLEFLAPISDLSAAPRSGKTALHDAVEKGRLDCVKVLTPFADMSLRDKDGYTPLFSAIALNQGAIAKFLLDKSEVKPVAKDGWTVAMAVARHSADTCLCMALKDIDWKKRDRHGNSVFDFLARVNFVMIKGGGIKGGAGAPETKKKEACRLAFEKSAPLDEAQAAVAKHGAEAFPMLQARLEAQALAAVAEERKTVLADKPELGPESATAGRAKGRLRL